MKTLFPRLSRIVLKDWLEYHPYDKEVPSDHFYIALSDDIQHEILFIDVEDHLVGVDYKCLACMLVCYFEDIVSQTDMWTSFINKHHKLYGKYLPFYDMTGYVRGKINLADIQFLIWHFSSNLPTQNSFINPCSIENFEVAKFVYAKLNELTGLAPKNKDLKTALTLPPDANINNVRQHLDFVFLGCYLHQFYFDTLLEEEKLDVLNQKDSHNDFDRLLDDRRVHLLFNRVSPILAQSSGEMLAHWAGETHPLYTKLMSLSKRKEGLFLYEGATATHLQMKHIASGILIELCKPDWKFSLVADVTTVRMGIVQWGDEWHAVGPAFPVMDAEYEKITEQEKYLFAPVASHLGIVKRVEECFLEANYNKQIAIFESKLNTFSFIDKVWEMYHLKYGADIMDRKMFDVYDITFNVDDDLENLVVFFNPRAGMEFYPNIAQCISIWDNVFFDKNAETNIEELIMNKRISSEFISFLIENKMIEIDPVSDKGRFHYVCANRDFLLRYWKKEEYLSEPQLFIE